MLRTTRPWQWHRWSSAVVLGLVLGGATGALGAAGRPCPSNGRLPACSPQCASPPAGCPAMCTQQDVAGAGGLAGCCAEKAFACSEEGDQSTTSDLNVLLIVSDDHGYCHFGFMAGECDGSGNLCTGEEDCAAGEHCVSSARCTTDATRSCQGDEDCDGGLCTSSRCASSPNQPCSTSAECGGGECVPHPLRLAELTCRNRQPAAVTETAMQCPDLADDPLLKDDKRFPFHRQKYPCANTTAGARKAVRTPFLDRLASEGAVFTRAHVGGNTCKPSRRVMHHGKHQRHLQYLWPEGTGRQECSPDAGGPPMGCKSGGEPCPSGRECEPAVHSIAWWVKRDNPAVQAAFFGKSEVLDAEAGSFSSVFSHKGRGIANFKCKKSDQACLTQLSTVFTPLYEQGAPAANPPLLPAPVFERVSGIGRVIDFLTDVTPPIISRTPNNGHPTSRRERAFYIWYAPKLPHESARPVEPFYSTLYGGKEPKLEREHLGRTSWFDAGVGGLLEYLQRTCVCTKQGTAFKKQSLYDSTVVIVLADHGFLLPGAKGNTRENTHRTVLIVNEPRHRTRGMEGLGQRVLGYDMPHGIDLLRTIVDYTGGTYDPQGVEGAAYPFSRSLLAYLDPQVVAAADTHRLRAMQFGQQGRSGVKEGSAVAANNAASDRNYLIVRPGLLGVCVNPTTGNGSLLPCHDDSQCLLSGQECRSDWKKCVNHPNPEKACQTDAQCVPTNLCVGPTGSKKCVNARVTSPPAGSYADFSNRDCQDHDDCVPDGPLCQPITLKVDLGAHEVEAPFGIDLAWELATAPDQEDSQTKDVAGGYLHQALKTALEHCTRDYWSLGNPDDNWTARSFTLCPWSHAD